MLADGSICGTKLRKRFMWDYWFCPKCCPESVRDNIRDLFRSHIIRVKRVGGKER